jgi:hypothetical protein
VFTDAELSSPIKEADKFFADGEEEADVPNARSEQQPSNALTPP